MSRDCPGTCPKVNLLKPFLTYAIGPGQQFAADLQYAQLPPKILAAGKATIAKLRQR